MQGEGDATSSALHPAPVTLRLIVDADACPVKDEIYRVARRYRLPVILVANGWMRTPDLAGLELIVVGSELNSADDWIVQHSTPADVVLTADIPLAARVVERGATCLDFRGNEFTPDNIGELLATRDLLMSLRDGGETIRGPRPFSPRDRGRFAGRLDDVVQRLRRRVQQGR